MNSKVSVIIPFVKLDGYTCECISHCLKLDYPDYEIILLPDDKIDLPEELVNEKIKIVVTGDKNISAKRNIGIKNATGDYYACIDSDAYPVRNWLSEAIKTFSENTDIWVVGGPNITPPGDNIKQKCVGNSLKSFLVSGGNSYHKKIVKSRACVHLPACNFILSKQAVKVLKGFNERIFTGEDVEICKRVINEKKKVYYNNKAIIYHHNRTLFKPYLLQRLTYGLSVFKLLKEDVSFHTLSLFAPMIFILFIIVGGFFLSSENIFSFFYFFIMSIYLGIIIIETLRCSDKLQEIPLTFASLLIGNLSPGIGSILALIGINWDKTVFGLNISVKKLYGNHARSNPPNLNNNQK